MDKLLLDKLRDWTEARRAWLEYRGGDKGKDVQLEAVEKTLRAELYNASILYFKDRP